MVQAIRVIMWNEAINLPRIELHEEFGTRSAALNAAKHMNSLIPQYNHAAIVGDFGQDLYVFERRVVVNAERIAD